MRLQAKGRARSADEERNAAHEVIEKLAAEAGLVVVELGAPPRHTSPVEARGADVFEETSPVLSPEQEQVSPSM